MIDPAAGAMAGLIAISLFVIGPTSSLLNLLFNRFATICLGLAGSFFVVVLVMWIQLDVLDPKGGRRMWMSFPLVILSLIVPLIAAILFGAPAAFVRFLLRRGSSDRLWRP